MNVDERARQQLFQKLDETIGPTAAAILMEHLPPVGWADVATKRDLDALGVATKRDLDAHMVAMERDLDALRQTNRAEHQMLASKDDLRDLQHKLTVQMIAINSGSMIAVAALAFGAARLF